MTQILILGTHGQNNLGDELLLQAFVKYFGKDFQIITNSYKPEETAEQYNVKTFDTVKDISKLPSIILQSKVVIFDGGNIVKELYTAYGGSKYAVLIKLLLIVIASRLFFKKIFLSNIGIGPVDTFWGRFLSKSILFLANIVTVRDIQSKKIATNLGYDLRQVPDAAFIFSREDLLKNVENIRVDKNEVKTLNKLALNLCRNIAKPEAWDNFEARVISTIKELHSENPKIEIIGVPMQIDFESNDDLVALENLKVKLNKEIPNLNFKIAKPKHIDEVVEIANWADLVLTTRLHLGILSTILAKPFLIFKYDIKINGFLENYNIEDLGIDILNQNTASFTSQISNTIQNFDTVASRLDKVYKQNHQADQAYFADLNSKI
jgi:polysaccharide pyruvyl transferase WcaK-like protein